MIYMIYDIVYPCISYESSLFTLLQRVDARAKKVHLPHQPLGSEPVEQGWTFHRWIFHGIPGGFSADSNSKWA